jgi:hypothetical protein
VDCFYFDPAERRAVFHIAHLELDAFHARIGIHLGLQLLAEKFFPVRQFDFGNGVGPKNSQTIPQHHCQQGKCQKQRQRKGGARGPNKRLALPPKSTRTPTRV